MVTDSLMKIKNSMIEIQYISFQNIFIFDKIGISIWGLKEKCHVLVKNIFFFLFCRTFVWFYVCVQINSHTMSTYVASQYSKTE